MIIVRNTVEKNCWGIQLAFVLFISLLFCSGLLSNVDKVEGGPAAHWEGEYQNRKRWVDIPEIWKLRKKNQISWIVLRKLNWISWILPRLSFAAAAVDSPLAWSHSRNEESAFSETGSNGIRIEEDLIFKIKEQFIKCQHSRYKCSNASCRGQKSIDQWWIRQWWPE